MKSAEMWNENFVKWETCAFLMSRSHQEWDRFIPFYFGVKEKGKKCCNTNVNEPENSMCRGKVWDFLPAGPIHAMRKGREESKHSLVHSLPWLVLIQSLTCLLLERKAIMTWWFLRLQCHSVLNLNWSQRINWQHQYAIFSFSQNKSSSVKWLSKLKGIRKGQESCRSNERFS